MSIPQFNGWTFLFGVIMAIIARIISKKDSRNQVSTIRYDVLGQVEAETLPSADGP
jgi:hypothetical protein